MAINLWQIIFIASTVLTCVFIGASEDTWESHLSKYNLTGYADNSSTEHVKHFYLWTREYRNGRKFELLDPRNESLIKASHFNDGYTYVIVHGFLGYGTEVWIRDLKDQLLKSYECNVISVDWEAGSEWFLPSYYFAAQRVGDPKWFLQYYFAAKRVKGVGNQTHYLLKSLQRYKGLLLENVHFIGHSLGAHVAGFASKPFQGRIGRISALDPAGPEFHKVSSKQRVDKSDAIFVDVMHTNACNGWPYWTDCFGLGQNIGHVDFWPNGGLHQPYCVTGLKGEIGCDHEMAYRYYIESFNYDPSTTYFLSRPCQSWRQFIAGNCSCGKKQQFMGINVVPGASGPHYLKTSSMVPFAFTDNECATHYHVLQIVSFICLVVVCVIVLIISVLTCSSRRFRTCFWWPCYRNSEEHQPLLGES